jgi:hypothetical protein
MPVPKRPVPLSALVVFVVLAAISGIIGNRTDALLEDHFGKSGQVVASVVSWPYIPMGVAVVAILLMWWWSQSSPPPTVTVDDWDGRNAMQMRVSIVGHPGISVVRFQLHADGERPLPAAQAEKTARGDTVLRDSKSATLARPNVNWLETPIYFDNEPVRQGWIGFSFPSDGYSLVGRNPRLVALLSDGKEIKVSIPDSSAD